ncbi:MAG: hypothetical protein ACYTKD_07745 [Planctomycetota bacterium]
MREYSRLQTVIANIPYAVMVLVGAGTIGYGFDSTLWALVGSSSYLAYGIAGALWIMVFVCPYCGYYGTRGCPCGYGTVSARLAKKAERNCFSEKFKRHIPVIVPLWLIPVACGGIALWHTFSWQLAGLIVAFVVNSYVILPLVSRKRGCADCPQRDDCPWMGKQATES